MDEDFNGSLTMEEVRCLWMCGLLLFVTSTMQFRKGLKKLGLFFSEQDASDLFQFGDSDGNGTLDFDEFGKVLSVLV